MRKPMQTNVAAEVGEESSPTLQGTRRRLVQPSIFLLVLALLALLAYGIIATGRGPLSGGPAPDFTLTLFGGGQLALSELRGQVVVINFWASWCPPCRDEALVLERVGRSYHDRGVTFVGVDYMDTEPPARAYIEEFGITYPNGPDLGTRIARDYHIKGVPETFFITPQGEIAEVFIGPLGEARLTAILERLLAPTGGE